MYAEAQLVITTNSLEAYEAVVFHIQKSKYWLRTTTIFFFLGILKNSYGQGENHDLFGEFTFLLVPDTCSFTGLERQAEKKATSEIHQSMRSFRFTELPLMVDNHSGLLGEKESGAVHCTEMGAAVLSTWKP